MVLSEAEGGNISGAEGAERRSDCDHIAGETDPGGLAWIPNDGRDHDGGGHDETDPCVAGGECAYVRSHYKKRPEDEAAVGVAVDAAAHARADAHSRADSPALEIAKARDIHEVESEAAASAAHSLVDGHPAATLDGDVQDGTASKGLISAGKEIELALSGSTEGGLQNGFNSSGSFERARSTLQRLASSSSLLRTSSNDSKQRALASSSFLLSRTSSNSNDAKQRVLGITARECAEFSTVCFRINSVFSAKLKAQAQGSRVS